MKKTVSLSRPIAAICLALALGAVPSTIAQIAPKRPALPNVDKRFEGDRRDAEIPAAKKEALDNLRQRISGARVSIDPLLKSPNYISAGKGFLTGANGVGRTVSAEAAKGIDENDAHRPIKAFLNEHSRAFGYGAEVLPAAKINRDYVTEHNGLKTTVWQQEVDGIPVFEALLIGHITKKGELVNLSTHFLPDAARAADAGTPNRRAAQNAPALSAAEAIVSAAKDVGSELTLDQVTGTGSPEGAIKRQIFTAAPVLKGEIYVELVWLPTSDSAMRLCWQVIFLSHARGEMFKSIVDAQTGEVGVRHNLTAYISDATYNVYTSDSPSPFSPGHQFPDPTQPALVPRVLVTTNAVSVLASPNGWINDGDTETLGNNVDAHLDRDDDNAPDLPRPNGGATRVFDFPLDLTQAPATYGDAAVVNLFYWNNWMHDKLYELGFTEAAGNFQLDNFGRGGVAGDPVLADAQDGLNLNDPFHDNNANMFTLQDGISPRMQMYKFSGPTPDRDGDLDAEVILHEYTHGLSTRRVGGGVGIGTLQAAGMGEGWSDFYALALLSEPSDDINAAYAVGGYLTRDFFGLVENYYFGIRRYPYSTDMTKNPLTFKDIDPAQASAHPGIPTNPIWVGLPADEVHAQGEVWCVALWEARAALINKHGYAIGNQLILQLVTDGMNLSPANPTFLQSRDAILLADEVLTGGANQNELWAAFAKRGMGALAGSPASTTTAGVIESFDVPGLALSSFALSGGNGNGIIDFNECNNLQLVLTNIGLDASNITVQLTTTTPEVIIAQAFSTYPNIPAGGSAPNFTPFKISTSPFFICGTQIELTMIIKSDVDTRTNFFRLPSGTTGSATRYDNNVPVPIPDANPIGATSPIIVTNFTGTVGKVAVSLHITHTFDFDLLLELVAPDGTSIILSQNNGGAGDNYGSGCSPDSFRTRFDENATIAIAAANPPFVGIFQPEQPLSNFNLKSGTNVNGIWQLRVTDQIPIDVGAIQCWSLFLSPQTCTDGGGECPGSDLGVSMVAFPDPAVTGSNLTYTITVTNDGPSTAKGVVLSHTLPAGAIFVTATNSQGTSQHSGGTVTCNLGTINARRSATVTVTVIPTVEGIASSTASVGSNQADPNPANNSVTVLTRVVPPSADLAVSIVDAPDPVSAGAELTYTITVTNRGPTLANNVMLTNTLPSTASFVSASSTQGTFVNAGGTIIYNLGTLANGGGAVVTIVVRPTVIGSITMTSRVVSSQADLFPGNNLASASTTVSPAADVALSIVDTPDPVVSGSNVLYVLTVTNRGPYPATSVALNGTLPGNATFVTNTVSQGTFARNDTVFTFSIGTLLSGSSATLTVEMTAPIITGLPQTLTFNATASAGQADPDLANNSATATTLVAQPFVAIAQAGSLLTAESFSPVNGSVDAGETVSVILRLRNAGNINTTNIVATLLPTGGVTSPSAPQTYGLLAAGGPAVENTFSFTADGNSGDIITATLQIQDGGAPFTNVTFTFALPTVHEFANTNAITIPDSGPATPYPSQITVAGVTGLVDKVTVTLNKINHTYPDDIDVLLVDPTGRKVLLMSDAGGVHFLNNVILTLDAGAASALADSDQLVSGNFVPANYESGGEPGDFFAGAPEGPYETSLNILDATSPNGTWSLYVVDDTSGDSGNIAGGWSLAITTIDPVNPVFDLTVSMTSSASAVLLNEQISYTIAVSNAGPGVASNVTLNNPLPPNTTALTPTTFALGSLPVGSNATVVVTLTSSAVGLLTNTATISIPGEIDVNVLNNTASAVTIVELPVADLAVAVSASTANPIVGNNLTYTITVTNHGPNNALGVVVTNRLPTGTAFVSGLTSQGTISESAGVVTCALGNMGAGNTATISITATPLSTGNRTNTANVVTGSNDPNSGNNSASVVTLVANPAPIIVASGASLVSESLLTNGVIDPGELVQISFALANVGSADTANLVATLQATGGIAPSTQQSYGALAFGGAAVSRTYNFAVSATNSGTVTATLQLQDGANDLGTATFTFDLPALNALANTTFISIPSSGPATPYPSTITVSNVSGVVSKVSVSINGLTHAFPDDVDMILVSPSGQKTVLMSDAGGAHSISNVNLTFDDAGSAAPDATKITNGVVRPTDYESGETLPPPAPAGPYAASFASFAGGNPNGNWSLYINDDTGADSGFISGGWSLALTTVNTINPSAGLSVSVSAPGSVFTGGTVNYTIVVSNSGPATASSVVLTDFLPFNFALTGAVLSQGSASVAGHTVTCDLGLLGAGAKATITLTGTPNVAGTMTNNVAVTANETDLYLANNSAQAITLVIPTATARLGSVLMLLNGSFQLTLTGEPGLSYRIEASTDFAGWIPVQTNVAGGDGKFIFTDTAATNFNPRFYRAMRLP